MKDNVKQKAEFPVQYTASLQDETGKKVSVWKIGTFEMGRYEMGRYKKILSWVTFSSCLVAQPASVSVLQCEGLRCERSPSELQLLMQLCAATLIQLACVNHSRGIEPESD